MAQKGPGKAYRKKISLREILKQFPDDATAEAWFAKQRWGDSPVCPHCGSTNVLSGAAHKMPYRCREKECRKRFSVRTGTVMQCSNLGYQTWALALYLVLTSLKGVSSMKLHNDLNITQKSAWHLAHRIREGLTDGLDVFPGPVEADETYFGGKRKNMSNEKRKELAETGAGRGTAGKVAVAGVKDRGRKRVRAQVVEHTDKATLQSFVSTFAAPGATIYTDEASAYDGLPNHEAVKHGVGEYVRGMVHTNGMESFWSMLKRGYIGTFHKMSPKHLNRYVTEFEGRYNIREFDTVDQLETAARRMDGKRLRYRDLIEPNGLDSGARSLSPRISIQ